MALYPNFSASPHTDWIDYWTGDFVFENQWQSFRTKKDRNLELTSVFYTYPDTTRKKIALKIVDI